MCLAGNLRCQCSIDCVRVAHSREKEAASGRLEAGSQTNPAISDSNAGHVPTRGILRRYVPGSICMLDAVQDQFRGCVLHQALRVFRAVRHACGALSRNHGYIGLCGDLSNGHKIPGGSVPLEIFRNLQAKGGKEIHSLQVGQGVAFLQISEEYLAASIQPVPHDRHYCDDRSGYVVADPAEIERDGITPRRLKEFYQADKLVFIHFGWQGDCSHCCQL